MRITLLRNGIISLVFIFSFFKFNLVNAQYCTSNLDHRDSIMVAAVLLDTIENYTGATAGITADYTQYSTSVHQGLQYTITVAAVAYPSTNIYLYIDWNQDNDFDDPDESMLMASNLDHGGYFRYSFSIPSNAVLGNTRMRVLVVKNQVSGSPCLTNGIGESEDYTLTILPPPTCPQPKNLSVAVSPLHVATFEWEAGGSETEWEVEYGPSGFSLGSGTIINATSLSATSAVLQENHIYQFYVKAVCSAADHSYYSGPVSFNTFDLGTTIEYDYDCGQGFQSISNDPAATELDLYDDDFVALTLPFTFYFQGQGVNDITLANDGVIMFNTLGGFLENNNIPIDNGQEGIYPFWDDLSGDGGVWTKTEGTAPNRKYIVEWKRLNNGHSLDNLYEHFEIVLHENSGEIYFYYQNTVVGDENIDYGKSATIGLKGPLQYIQLSHNDNTFLQEHSCVRFYYPTCPAPSDLILTNITYESVDISWTPSTSSEHEWKIEYGPVGFAPGSGTTELISTNPSATLNGLNSLTDYEVRVYEQCGIADFSTSITDTFQTLSKCASPENIALSATADSIFVSWDWTETYAPISSFNIRYSPSGTSGGSIFNSTNIPSYTDTIIDNTLIPGAVYTVYVQSVCGTDTSFYTGPFTVVSSLANDEPCNAFSLAVDGNTTIFNNTGATVGTDAQNVSENSIFPLATGAQTTTGWESQDVSKTTWFKFIAPASGKVRIDATSIEYDGKIAVYKPVNCDDYTTYALIAANDDDLLSSSLSPNFTICGLTPNAEYYLMYAASNSVPAGDYALSIKESVIHSGTTLTPQREFCAGTTVDLSALIQNNDAGGSWSSTNVGITISGTNVNTGSLTDGNYTFTYIVEDGCNIQQTNTTITVFEPSRAGNNAMMKPCRNQPISLLDGRSGNFHEGGFWLDENMNPVTAVNYTTGNDLSIAVYYYVVSNGVCDNDTAKITVSVQSCNYLEVETITTSSFSCYPNPTTGMVTISTAVAAEYSVTITDLKGSVISQQAIREGNKALLDLSNYEKGVYLVQISSAGYTETQRVILE